MCIRIACLSQLLRRPWSSQQCRCAIPPLSPLGSSCRIHTWTCPTTRTYSNLALPLSTPGPRILSGTCSGSTGLKIAGNAVCDGGLVIDLRDMRRIEIDAAGKTAWAETGLTAREYSEAVGAHRLATGFGVRARAAPPKAASHTVRDLETGSAPDRTRNQFDRRPQGRGIVVVDGARDARLSREVDRLSQPDLFKQPHGHRVPRERGGENRDDRMPPCGAGPLLRSARPAAGRRPAGRGRCAGKRGQRPGLRRRQTC